MTFFSHFVPAIAASFLIASGSAFAHGDADAVRVETLMKTDKSWDGTPYRAYPQGTPQLSLLKYTIAPNTSLPWHLHRMPNAAYVLSGALVVEKREDGQTRKLKAGDVLPEMVDGAHRGYTGDEGVSLIVFYAGAEGMPFATPAP